MRYLHQQRPRGMGTGHKLGWSRVKEAVLALIGQRGIYKIGPLGSGVCVTCLLGMSHIVRAHHARPGIV